MKARFNKIKNYSNIENKRAVILGKGISLEQYTYNKEKDIVFSLNTAALCLDVIDFLVLNDIETINTLEDIQGGFKGSPESGLQESMQTARYQNMEKEMLYSKLIENQTAKQLLDSLDLENHEGIYAQLEDRARDQSSINVGAEIIKEMAVSLAQEVDEDILANLRDVSSGAPDHFVDIGGSGASAITLSDIVSARSLLRKQNISFDNNDVFMLISPEQEANILQISDFTDASKFGSNQGVVQGVVGKVFGLNVLVSSLVGASEALFYHRDHVGIAFGMQPSFEQGRNLKNTSTEYLLQVLWGCASTNLGRMGVRMTAQA